MIWDIHEHISYFYETVQLKKNKVYLQIKKPVLDCHIH